MTTISLSTTSACKTFGPENLRPGKPLARKTFGPENLRPGKPSTRKTFDQENLRPGKPSARKTFGQENARPGIQVAGSTGRSLRKRSDTEIPPVHLPRPNTARNTVHLLRCTCYGALENRGDREDATGISRHPTASSLRPANSRSIINRPFLSPSTSFSWSITFCVLASSSTCSRTNHSRNTSTE